MELFFEQGQLKNLNELEELYDQLNDYLIETINYPGWRKNVYPIRETARIGIKEKALYIVRENNKIVGSAIIRNRPEKAYRTVKWGIEAADDQVAVIYTFVIHPQYLKKGIGKKLLYFIIEKCRALDQKALRLDVYEKNTLAIHLYESCGFHYVDTVDLGYGNYGLHTLSYMKKYLNSKIEKEKSTVMYRTFYYACIFVSGKISTTRSNIPLRAAMATP